MKGFCTYWSLEGRLVAVSGFQEVGSVVAKCKVVAGIGAGGSHQQRDRTAHRYVWERLLEILKELLRVIKGLIIET